MSNKKVYNKNIKEIDRLEKKSKVKKTKNDNKQSLNVGKKTKEKNIKDNNKKVQEIIVSEVKNTKIKKKKRKILIVILSILLFSLLCLLGYYLHLEYEEKIRLENIRKEKELIEKITSYYNPFVKTKEEVEIYSEKEEIIGKLYNAEVSLEETTIDKDTKYFKIMDFEATYIKYDDVEKIENLSLIDSRYKNYIVFNQNIVTNDKTRFYDEDDNLLYEFNKSFELPIIIKETDKYGVEFNNRLLFVKSEDLKEIKDNHNTNIGNASGVAVLNYHAFYDETNYEERRACVTSICHSKAQFKTHLDYLKENNIFTLTAKELEMYVDGKLQLPKSVYITIDDGPKTEHAVNMLTEYQMNGTIFIVTNWFTESTYYKTEYIELHSHTHDLHRGGLCSGGQGSGLKCLDRETILTDLKQSREELGGSTVFCFPFYEYNSYAISLVEEAGFTMAFVGEYSDMLVKVGMNKFKLPRFVITTGTTMYAFDRYFDQIKN